MTAMTDEQIIDLWSPRLGEGIQRPVLGKNKIIAFGRACIAAERARADALEAALREFVDLKTLKLRMERSLTKSMAHGNNPSEQYHTWKNDYNHRKPAAWAAARALLEKKT